MSAHIIFWFIVSFSVPIFGREPWKTLQNQCKETEQKTEQCWNKFTQVPQCKTGDPLVSCVDTGLSNSRLCTEETKNKIRKTLKISKAIHDAICEHLDLRNELERHQPCWFSARVCARSFLNDIVVKEDLTEKDCTSAIEESQHCSSYEPECSDLQGNLTLSVYENSRCIDILPEGKEKFTPNTATAHFFKPIMVSIMVMIICMLFI